MTDVETVKLPYFISNKIGLFKNIKDDYEIDFNKSVESELNWLKSQRSVIDDLLNDTEFETIQKQISINIENSDINGSISVNPELKNEKVIKSIINDDDFNKNVESTNSISYNSNLKYSDKEELPPSLLDFAKNTSNNIDKTVIFNQKESSMKKGSFYDLNNKLNDLKDNIENRNLIISKIEKKDIFKRISDKNDKSDTEEFETFDVLGDLKKSLENYNLIISKLEKKNEVKKDNTPESIVKNVDKDNNKKEINVKPSPLIKSKSEISLIKLNEPKNTTFTKKPLSLIKSKSELALPNLNEIDISSRKKKSFEEKIGLTNNSNSLDSLLASSINEKKSKSTDNISTPSKKESNSIFRTPDKEKETNKKSVSQRFKAIWDSTTRGLHSTFSRNSSSSNNIKEKKKSTELFGSSIFSSSHNLYSSPERDPSISALAFSKGSKSTDFKREKLRDQYLKFGSASIPSKNKIKYLFGTEYENINIDFKDYKNKTNIFNSNFDDLKIYNSTSLSNASPIHSPPDSPLALRSKLYISNLDEFNSKDSPLKKEFPSFIPKHSKFKSSEIIKNKTNNTIATLASAKLIKKQEERLTLEKKQKIKMNVERHRIYLQRKKEIEEKEKEKLFTFKKKEDEEKEQEEKNKEKGREENRIKTEKILEQMKYDMEALIRKRNEKIKQVQEKKQALKQKELTKKSILMNHSRINDFSSIPITTTTNLIDKYKTNKNKSKVNPSSPLDTHSSNTSKNANG
ncbi:hypothetical protein BCR36DRAFT_98435 [Piromyces finnis]|uniref:Uncharacterized protein n=1 Tax=Piromyces finnis TaxID=1754191 RepID=A0A1Y1V4B4_9FUNG|nr:hypothetical protein BCR36DRAFT_98435 [Piromyces finnis]|eukprot:ORX46850.1 hypothetical protein BCR36DRAFT_98435 [Piromyces finnis]